MNDINQVQFHLDPKVGVITGVMIAVMVFTVALDLRWSQFERILKRPKAPVVGLIGQFLLLPLIAYVVARYFVDTPSVALGLLLVSSCPGGSMSNYLTHLARGDVATSVAMTGTSTATAVVMTPIIFAALASANPATAALLRDVGIEPGKILAMFVITIVLPIVAGMLLAVRRPTTTEKIKPWMQRIALLLFAVSIVAVLGKNGRLMLDFARDAAVPSAICFAVGLLVGYGAGFVVRLSESERRAVSLEVGAQNVALAMAIGVTFFPNLTGVAVVAAVYGVVQLLIGLPLIAIWHRLPPKAPT